MKTFILAGAVLLAASLTPVRGANIIVNGGFESTNNGFSQTLTPVGWTNVGHIDGVISYAAFGTPAYEGLYFYDLGGYGDAFPPTVGDGIEQTVATTAGSTYALSFGLTGENFSGSEFLNVIINGVPVQTFAVPLNPSLNGFQNPFVTESLNYVATSDTSTILFTRSGQVGANDPVIDNISFDLPVASGVPEPATLVLSGGSLLGLALLRRLRIR